EGRPQGGEGRPQGGEGRPQGGEGRPQGGEGRPGSGQGSPADELTDREVEVLRLIGRGLTNRQIGEALFISAGTAGVHVSNILRKLGVSSRVQAAALAQRFGLGD
ncbi:MAG: response regulator transcription factor, partial [Acidimicrobiales bacterium]